MSEKLSIDNSMGMASSKKINKNLVNSQQNYKKDFFKISEQDDYLKQRLEVSSHGKQEEEKEEEEKWLELREDYYSLAFYAFYVDEDETEENKILSQLQQKDFDETKLFELLCNPVISSGLSDENKSEFKDIKKDEFI